MRYLFFLSSKMAITVLGLNPQGDVHLPQKTVAALIILTWGTSLGLAAASGAEPVSFSRDILPILSDRCFHCHGPDESHRQADLRLDLRDAAVADRGGYATLVPGEPESSELWQRITSDDPSLLMPPPEAHRKPVSVREQELIRAWIENGAPWGRHWSFEPPVRPSISEGAEHPVDAFVHAKLKAEGMTPAPEAARHTLIRRLSFDLTGLPPPWNEVRKFLDDDSSAAYEQLVDRLLESPHYGERMAMWWLDAARYSDTDGYQLDATRENWPWRDYVIQSFNENKPFDQFTIEQFAGDLLPDATPEQILATCFHRNHMTNGEGGRDPEESRIDYVIDRVNTTGTVWLGLTLGCSQCHSHKFDPISHEDYYSLFAYFDSIDEDGRAGKGAKPYLTYQSPFAQRAVEEAQQVVENRKPAVAAARHDAEAAFPPWLEGQLKRVREGFQAWHPMHTSELTSVEGTVLSQEEDGTIQTSGPNPQQDDYRIAAPVSLSRVTGLRLEVFPHASHTDGKLSRGADGEFILTDVKLQVRRRGHSQLRDLEIAFAVASAEHNVSGKNYGKIADTLDDDPRNGWTTRSHDPRQPYTAVFALAQPLVLSEDEELVFVMFQRSTTGDANIGRFRLSITDQPSMTLKSLQPMPLEEVAALAVTDASQLDESLRERLFQQFLADFTPYQDAQARLDRAQNQLASVKKAAGDLQVMVLKEREKPRTSYILERGVWDAKGDPVVRSVPDAILPRSDDLVQTRLDLAQWIVDRQNPLTARVVVNQLWQICFGAGLVRTPGDFGLQGELPTHPQLLDYLAVELMESNWDIKHILRLIVTSQTYRQSSVVNDDLLERDPENRLLARGARFRLPSWMIRDAALASSGLLNPAVGGPPVMPYQPPGVWEEMFMGRFRYEASQGAPQFRRSLYAFWRRSAAPTFLFDSAQRQVCEVQPRRTNTPLHALTLLNDLSIREASRELARSALREHQAPSDRLTFLWQAILSRPATPDEHAVLTRTWNDARQYYQQSPGEVQRLLRFGQPEHNPPDSTSQEDLADLAALLVVANTIINLDEAMTHE